MPAPHLVAQDRLGCLEPICFVVASPKAPCRRARAWRSSWVGSGMRSRSRRPRRRSRAARLAPARARGRRRSLLRARSARGPTGLGTAPGRWPAAANAGQPAGRRPTRRAGRPGPRPGRRARGGSVVPRPPWSSSAPPRMPARPPGARRELRELLARSARADSAQLATATSRCFAPIAFRQRVVGHVSDEDMAEAELGGAGQRRGLAGHDELFDPQTAQQSPVGRSEPPRWAIRGPRRSAHDGGVLGEALLVARQSVEAGRQHGLDRGPGPRSPRRPGQLPAVIGLAQHPSVDEHPDELLGEEWVALGEARPPVRAVLRAGHPRAGRRPARPSRPCSAARGRSTPRWGCRRPRPVAARAARGGRGRGRRSGLRPSARGTR